MKPLQIVLLSVLVAVMTAAGAQAPARVRGTITAIDGNLLSVKSREGQDLKIELAPNATFAYMKRLSIADVKPGTPLGTSALTGPDGKIVALELHLFPAGQPVPGEGHRPWDLEPNSTMTNGVVTAVAEAGNGRELTLSYKDGAQRVVVPANIPIVAAQNGDRSLLVVGEYALFAISGGADGKLTATRVQITKDGVRPPQ
jgi:hypothetical protein